MLFDSTWPLRVLAGQTQSSSGLPAAIHRVSSIARTRGVIGSTRRAQAVFPCLTSRAPFRPLSHVTYSQRIRKHSSGRIPVSAKTEAIQASGSDATARHLAPSSALTTRSRRRSPDNTLSLRAVAITPHSTARFRTRRNTRRDEFTVAIRLPC
jgi:hypothetical protein